MNRLKPSASMSTTLLSSYDSFFFARFVPFCSLPRRRLGGGGANSGLCLIFAALREILLHPA